MAELVHGSKANSLKYSDAKKLGITRPQLQLLYRIVTAGISTFTLGHAWRGGMGNCPPRDWVTNIKHVQLTPKRRTLEILTEKGYFTFENNTFTVTEKIREINFI